MIEIETSSGSVKFTTSCFRIRFWWQEDRWRHEVISFGPSESLPRIYSIEIPLENEDPERVVSPIYQQIHHEVDPSGSVRVFLIGQSGPHHFSAAFLIEERPMGAMVDVDVADRCLAPLQALAATYGVEPSEGQWESESETHADPDAATNPEIAHRPAIVLTCEHPHSRLIFEANHPTEHAAEEVGLGSVQVQAVANLDPANKTHRFRYRWRWLNDPGQKIWDRTA